MSFQYDKTVTNVPKPPKTKKESMELDNSLSRKVKDTTAGFLGGVAQVAVGQPLDLVKVLIQTGQYKDSMSAVRGVYRSEGVLAFYKGSLTPLIGVGFINTIMFNICYGARRYVHEKQGAELTMSEIYLTGSFAGLATSVITSPVEQIRILMQTNNVKSTGQCVRDLVHKFGIRKGLFNGFGLTMLRDAHSHGIWFLSFEWLMKERQLRTGISREQIPTWEILLYGGILGDLLWLTTYPVDVIKTLKQTQLTKSSSEIVNEIWQQKGFRGFWAGIGPTLIRAAPVNASVFATVELCRRLLG